MRLLTIEGGGQRTHGRVRYFSFFDLPLSLSLSFFLSLPPARPPILTPQALGAFVGIRGNFACWQLFHSARESRAPEYYYSIVFQRRAIVFNHNAPLRKFRKAMRYVSRNKPGHRRISERFSATGIVIRP